MASVRQKTAPVREKRLGAIGAWSGTLDAFRKEAALGDLEPRIRTFAQDLPSDVEHALGLLRTIDGLAIVVHGPAGCAASLHGATAASTPWVVTNLTERDSIMGSDAKLRKAIQDIHRTYVPKAIAVVATPVVAINNDDIDSVTEELKDELSIPVIAVYTDGFRSRIGSTGEDVAVHSLVKHLLPLRRRSEGAHVNLLTVTENRSDLDHIRSLLSDLGIESQPFPRHLSVASAQKVSEGKVSIALDPDSGEYAGAALEDLYGIPFVKAPSPLGIEATGAWLRALGVALERPAEIAALIARETARLEPVLHAAKSFEGTRVFVNLLPSQALAFGAIARELGLVVAGIKAPWAASTHAALLDELHARAPETPFLVGEGQPFEEANLLARIQPDLYITAGSPPVHALRAGLAVVDLEGASLLGFAGVERLAREIERVLANRSLARFLAEADNQPYDPAWLKKSVHWYIKQEVK